MNPLRSVQSLSYVGKNYAKHGANPLHIHKGMLAQYFAGGGGGGAEGGAEL